MIQSAHEKLIQRLPWGKTSFNKKNLFTRKFDLILCWRRLERISWTDHVRSELVLQRVKEESDVLQTI